MRSRNNTSIFRPAHACIKSVFSMCLAFRTENDVPGKRSSHPESKMIDCLIHSIAGRHSSELGSLPNFGYTGTRAPFYHCEYKKSNKGDRLPSVSPTLLSYCSDLTHERSRARISVTENTSNGRITVRIATDWQLRPR
jgi:hypothetical protein